MAQFLQQEQARSAVRQTVATMTEVLAFPSPRKPTAITADRAGAEERCFVTALHISVMPQIVQPVMTVLMPLATSLCILPPLVLQVCWDKCMGSPGSYLSSREEACFHNCARGFLATTQFIVQVCCELDAPWLGVAMHAKSCQARQACRRPYDDTVPPRSALSQRRTVAGYDGSSRLLLLSSVPYWQKLPVRTSTRSAIKSCVWRSLTGPYVVSA